MTTSTPVPRDRRDRWREAGWLAAIGLGIFAVVLTLAHRAGALVYLPATWDAWFDIDGPRVYEDISQSTSVLNRGAYHPLFGLVGRTPYCVLSFLFGIHGVAAVQIELALVGMGLAMAFAALVRATGRGQIETLVFTALMVSGAAFTFFAGVPETFAFGGLTIVVGLLAVVRARAGWTSDVRVGMATALAAAVTVTNALPIAVGLWLRRETVSLKRVIGVALVCGVVGIAVQHWMFPRAPIAPLQMLGLGQTSISQPDDVFTGDLVPPMSVAHVGRVVRSFFVHSVVMPEPQVAGVAPKILTLVPTPLRVLSTQTAPIGWKSPWRAAGVTAWLLLLGWAAARFARGPRSPVSKIFAGAILVQLILHLVVGRETFLYSLHFEPLLVAFVASLVQDRGRATAVVLAAVATAVVAVNNGSSFGRATAAISRWGEPVDARPFEVATQREPISLPSRFKLPDLPIEVIVTPLDGGDLEVRAIEDVPGVWSIEVRADASPGRGLAVDMAATDLGSEPRPPLAGWAASSPQGEYLVLGHRWSVLTRPGPRALKEWNRASERCGLLEGPCVRMEFGKAKRWRFTIQDILARPLWYGTPLPWGDRAWRLLRPAWRNPKSAAAPTDEAVGTIEPGADGDGSAPPRP